MGDFEKAFPRTDRSDLLALLHNQARIRQGALALLEDIMAWDRIRVWLSGCSETVVRNGLPEGGSIGPLTYPTLPDDLLRSLLLDGFGVGINLPMPPAWQGHLWQCKDTPLSALVNDLVSSLRSGARLPSRHMLCAWPALEASAARALDICAPERVVMILHADDPIILASSAGELQRTLDAVTVWADRHGARFHASSSKSIFMSLPRCVESPPVLVLNAHSGTDRQELQYKVVHRWLGILWPSDLSFEGALGQAIAKASAACAPLIGLVAASAVPLTVAMEIFELKVESVLRVGRWLYALACGAQARLNELFESWARSLLGADPWRNGGVARSELGWHLCGFARAVRCVALRRARLWSRGASDWYGTFFAHAGTLEVGWAHSSAALLQKWGVADWPEVASICPTYKSYQHYVSSVLLGSCSIELLASLRTHQAQVPYTTFQDSPSHVISEVRSLGFSWDVQIRLRGWFRLRAGLPCLRALHGRRSNARHQVCIFCGTGVRNATVHAIGLCRVWGELRNIFLAALAGSPSSPDEICKSALGINARAAGFQEAVDLCYGIDRGASEFWRRA